MPICTSRLQKGNSSCWVVDWYGGISWGEKAVRARGRQQPCLFLWFLFCRAIACCFAYLQHPHNCTERCVLHTSPQPPSSHLLYQINHREKTSACPGCCFSICHSFRRCFREGFDVGFPGQGWHTVLQNLDLGQVFPAAPIRNELECFILVSDTF